MKPQLAHMLTRLHSREWKARYGSEFEALLVDVPASPATIADVALSAIGSQRRALTLLAAIASAAIVPVALTRADPPTRVSLTERVQTASRPLPKCGQYSSVLHRSQSRCALG